MTVFRRCIALHRAVLAFTTLNTRGGSYERDSRAGAASQEALIRRRGPRATFQIWCAPTLGVDFCALDTSKPVDVKPLKTPNMVSMLQIAPGVLPGPSMLQLLPKEWNFAGMGRWMLKSTGGCTWATSRQNSYFGVQIWDIPADTYCSSFL